MHAAVIILIIAICIIVMIVKGIAKHIEKHGLLILVLWFLSGHALDGKHRTDAGWFSPGTQVVNGNHQGRASRWHHRPRAHRALVRTGFTLAVVSGVYGWFTARTLTEISLAVAALVLIAAGQYVAVRKVKLASHQRSTVNPLTEAVSQQLGMSPQAAIGSVSIDPGYSKAEGMQHIGTIVLPDNWAANPGQREALEHLLQSRLGVPLSFDWRTSKHPATLRISRTPVPPSMVPLDSVLDTIRDLSPDMVLLGMNGKGEPRYWDLGAEDPGALVAAPSRRGKTTLLLSIAAQALSHGAEKVTVLDPKMVGVDEALAGVPGVSVWNNPQDIESGWSAVAEFKRFMDARIKAYAADRTLEFPRALLIIDEISMFAAMSSSHWRDTKDKSQSAKPPVFNDLAAVLWMGAAMSCNTLVFGQRVDHGITGGLMDSFGVRLMAGHTKRSWERTIGTSPVPPATKQRGRFWFYNGGGSPEEIQVVYGDHQAIRDLALSGTQEMASDTLVIELLRDTEQSEAA